MGFYLCFFKVQVFADGGEQATKALKGFFVMVLQQLHHTIMHDGFSQHLEFEEFSNELDVTYGSPPGFVLGFFQLIVKSRPLLRLLYKENNSIL